MTQSRLQEALPFRILLISIALVFFLVGYFLADRQQNIMLNGDSSGYYMHVVSALINNDIGDYDKTISGLIEHHPGVVDPRTDKFGVRKTPKGLFYIKYTIGVGVMELPGFLIGHIVALVHPKYKTDGWSPPYMFFVHISKVFYIFLGFWFLTAVLLQYFSKREVALTVIAIAFGSNLFYHGIFLTLAHSFLFFDICLLIYLTTRFYEAPKAWKAIGIGVTIGLITITRIPEVFSAVVPVFWGVHSLQTLKERGQFIVKHYQYLLLAIIGFLLMLSPQIMYWYYVSGQLFFNPYQGEGFNFLQPQIFKGWFSFQNGWLIYTPIMAFAVIGLISVWKNFRSFFLPVFLFLLLNSWVHYSYYTHNYFPGLGSRPMIDGYPLLAFGIAAFFYACKRNRVLKVLSYGLFGGFVFLNLFQTWQMHNGLIWTQNGTSAFYRASFLKTTHTKESLRSFDSDSTQPNDEKLTLIDTLYFNDFESLVTPSKSDHVAFSGQFSVLDTTSRWFLIHNIHFNDHNIQPGEWLYVGVKAYRAKGDKELNVSKLEQLVIEFKDKADTYSKVRSIKIAKHINNETNSFWHLGKTGVWGDAGFFLKVPGKADNSWIFKTYIDNASKGKIYLDDMIVLRYKKL